MFKNYIKIAFRNIFKYKVHSIINILGLAIAIACCLLLILFIRNELSYDSFHEQADRIFRVNSVFEQENSTHIQAMTQAPIGTALKQEFSEVELTVRFVLSEYIVKYQDNIFTEKITYTDADFFKMFSFKLLKTNTDQALKDKNSIVISEDIAKKYFGEDEPLGKRISISRSGQFHDFIVTAVIENVPENSSIQYDILLSFGKLKNFVNESYFTNWGLFSVCTYVQLYASSHAEGINSKLPALIEKYVGKSRAKYFNAKFAENAEKKLK